MTNTYIDDDGQPLNRMYGRKRLNDRTIDELIGMVKGITADGIVNQGEAEFLFNWMKRNTKYCEDRIVNTLYSRIKEMLVDKVLDKQEQSELFKILKSISGEQCPSAQVEATAAVFPLDKPPPSVEVAGSVFCLTGKFAYGPRKICSTAIIERGGIVIDGVYKNLDYLVIGSLCSSEWIHTTYGRKIEKAMAMQDEHSFEPEKRKISIIHEDHWARYVFL